MAALAGSPLALLSADLPISYLHHLELELPDAPIFVGQAASELYVASRQPSATRFCRPLELNPLLDPDNPPFLPSSSSFLGSFSSVCTTFPLSIAPEQRLHGA